MCGGRAEAVRRCPTVVEALRSRVTPVVGSCSTGEDGNGETRPKGEGKGGRWPSSLGMADGGGNGGV
jgi:hypothetical protein